MMAGRFGLVVFGATGFTGQFVVEYAARAVADAKKDGNDLTFAVAGRNEQKLVKVLAAASKNTGMDLTMTECIICDAKDELSLKNMAKRAKVILNCVGPYRFTGEAVVKAAISEGSHHVDISGEPEYLESMQLKYHDECKEKGIYVIGACGFDSIPSDMGRELIHQKMEGPVNSVEMYLNPKTDGIIKGPFINFATWQSAIRGYANYGELRKLRKILYPERLPKCHPKLKKRGFLHKSDLVNQAKWCLFFPGSDRSVMFRSEMSRFIYDGRRPAQVQTYVQRKSWFSGVMMALFFGMVGIMSKFGLGRYLLETFPGIFSFGMVTREGPQIEVMESSEFEMTLVGCGWAGKDESLEISGPMNRSVMVQVKGKNPGYGMTCETMVQSGIVLLTESNLMPFDGGVLTPGYAFAKTSLIQRLHQRGVKFDATIVPL